MITIREAGEEDISGCEALQAVYTTSAVWRIERAGGSAWSSTMVRNKPVAPESSLVAFQLQQVRLPRTRTLKLPSATIPLAESWSSASVRLVAQDEERICGYLLVQILPIHQQGLVMRLLVDAPMRGKGIGKALVSTARVWATNQGLDALLAHVPVRNVGGSAFYRRCGFTISGLVEHFYITRESALMLMRKL
jgi:ribosomal protein S18 acetylase RimI-like enzyme